MGMLTSVGDFFGNMKRRGAEVAQAGADKISGLRGSAQAGAAEYGSWGGAGNNSAFSEYGPTGPSSEQAPGLRQRVNAGAQEALGAQRQMGANAASAVKSTAGSGLKLIGSAARVANPLLQGYNVVNEGSKILDPEISTGDKWKAAGRFGLRTAGSVVGTALGGAIGGVVAPGVGAIPGGAIGATGGYLLGDEAADALLGPDKTKGVLDKVGGRLLGAEAKTASPAAPAAPATNGQPEMVGTAGPSGNTLNGHSLPNQPVTVGNAPMQESSAPEFTELTDGNRARPGVLTDSNIGVPVPGQGAFKVGNNPAQAINTGAPQPNSVQALAYNRAHGLGGPATTGQPGGGVFGEIAGLAAARTRDVGALRAQAVASQNAKLGVEQRGQDLTNENNKATLAATIAQRNLELEKWKYDKEHTEQNEQEKRVGERNKDYVQAKAGNTPARAQLLNDPATRAAEQAKIGQETADLNDRIKHTQSLTGKPIGKLSDPQHSLLLKANDIRERLEPYRNSTLGWAQDFFGNKRFDSRNLYSYLPAREKTGEVKPAIPETFGYSVEMGNGNKMKVYSVVNKDGGTGFNFTGPNDPVDADAMEIMAPAIKAAQAKAGKK